MRRLIDKGVLIATKERSGRDGGSGEKREEEVSDPHVGKLVSCTKQ